MQSTPSLRLPLLLLLLSLFPLALSFSVSDYDSYGSKIAGNDLIGVQITNQDNSYGYLNFYTNYSNPKYSNTLQTWCSIFLDETWYVDHGSWSMFAYGVTVGARDTSLQSIVWWGENNGGNWNDHTVNLTQMTVAAFQGMTVVPDFSCQPNGGTTDDNLVPATLTVATAHEEFFQMAVQPEGLYAIAIANTFGFVMDLQNLHPVAPASIFTYLWQKPAASPLYTTALDQKFGPRVIALESKWGVVAGWVQNDATKQWSCVAFLFNHTASSIILSDRWQFSPNSSDWRASIGVGDASTWKPVHDISVALREDGVVLLGVQLYNTVWLMRVQGGRLIVVGSKSQAQKQVGFGKTVSFTNTGAAQILYNTYTLDYSTIISPSAVQLYEVPDVSELNATMWTDAYPEPDYVYPNPTQQVATVLSSTTFISALSTPSNLFLLDLSGNTLFIQPAAPGLYQPTVSGYDSQEPCPAGTFKNSTSYQSCSLCPPGSYRDLSISGSHCVPCTIDTFCPLGAVAETPSDLLADSSQGFVYPASPEATIFDDIMFKNIFFLHGPAHCVGVSPIFWGLIVLAVLLLVLGCMFRLRYCVNDAKSRKIRRFTKFIFKRADLVKEGEHWIGGLMSIVLVVFIIVGIWFATTFIAQYPFETAANPNFACETTYNAKFSSSMLSVALPVDEVIEPMYEMLSEQQLSLIVDIINTNISCDDASAAVVTSVITSLPFTCEESALATITLNVTLPEHTSTIQFTLKGAQLIGGLRLSLEGEEEFSTLNGDNYHLRQVISMQSLSSAAETLQKEVTLPISITKVINSTEPLASGAAVEVSGLWIPLFPTASDAMFMSDAAYQQSSSSPFVITLPVTESQFYVFNQQQPIARSPEAAFKTLLYVIMLLEVFGMAFLIFKLVQPLVHCAALKGKGRSVKKVWDRPDSSDEEDWLEDLLYGDQVKPADLSARGNGRGSARGGVREMTEAEMAERARQRQERREAKDGKTPQGSARGPTDKAGTEVLLHEPHANELHEVVSGPAGNVTMQATEV